MPKRKDSSARKGGGVESEKPKRSTPPDAEWDKLSQREKFIRTARELGCEENLDRFDEAVKRIGKARRPPQETGKTKKENKPG